MTAVTPPIPNFSKFGISRIKDLPRRARPKCDHKSSRFIVYHYSMDVFVVKGRGFEKGTADENNGSSFLVCDVTPGLAS